MVAKKPQRRYHIGVGHVESKVTKANDTQIGGSHYKNDGLHEEHWDRAWRLRYDCYQYIITKWIERWREKGGLQDLEKARHALDKYIEVVRQDPEGALSHDPLRGPVDDGSDAGRGYVRQD